MIAPVIVCVVDTGMPPSDAPMSVTAPANSAHEPLIGLSVVMRIPIVRTMRQPPVSVPRPIAAWQMRMIQNGISRVFR
jgi:hypothetical protein